MFTFVPTQQYFLPDIRIRISCCISEFPCSDDVLVGMSRMTSWFLLGGGGSGMLGLYMGLCDVTHLLCVTGVCYIGVWVLMI